MTPRIALLAAVMAAGTACDTGWTDDAQETLEDATRSGPEWRTELDERLDAVEDRWIRAQEEAEAAGEDLSEDARRAFDDAKVELTAIRDDLADAGEDASDAISVRIDALEARIDTIGEED